MLRILWTTIVSLVVVLGRRLIGRKLRPSYSVRQEMFMEVFDRISVDMARRSFEDLRQQERAFTPPSSGAEGEEAPVRVAAGLDGVWFRVPGAAGPRRALLWLHGGAHIMGSVMTHRDLLHRMAAAGACDVLAIDYRLAPEHPCPASIEDAVAAHGFLRARGYAPDEIVIGGDSAGGGVAVATVVALRDAGEPTPRGVVLFSPWVDLDSAELRTDPSGFVRLARRAAEAYRGALDARDPRVSPLYADLKGLPPALLHLGGAEPLAPEMRALGQAWARAGSPITTVEWEDMPHVFQLLAGVFPQADEAVEAVGRFILGGDLAAARDARSA